MTLTPIRSYAWQLPLNLLLPVAIAVLVHHGIERRYYTPRHGGQPNDRALA